MEKLGKTLHYYFHQRSEPFSLKTVCQIGIKILEQLKCIHETGFVYNDLKLENIMVGDRFNSPSSLHQIKLIDFGLATKFIDKNGDHIPQKEENTFVGNLAFCSKYAMAMKTRSRRDDLISLCYLLIYVFKGRLDVLPDIDC